MSSPALHAVASPQPAQSKKKIDEVLSRLQAMAVENHHSHPHSHLLQHHHQHHQTDGDSVSSRSSNSHSHSLSHSTSATTPPAVPGSEATTEMGLGMGMGQFQMDVEMELRRRMMRLDLGDGGQQKQFASQQQYAYGPPQQQQQPQQHAPHHHQQHAPPPPPPPNPINLAQLSRLGMRPLLPPAPLSLPSLPSDPYAAGGARPVAFRQGDWICASPACCYHNFQRNELCIQCGWPRPLPSHMSLRSQQQAPPPLSSPSYSSNPPSYPSSNPPSSPFSPLTRAPPPRLAPLHPPPCLLLSNPGTRSPAVLTPSGRAFASPGRTRNVSGDESHPVILFWPDNEPLPEPGQVRPPLAGIPQPPILNTGNKGPIEHQPGDWYCHKCEYLNWRRRKVCQTCFPFAEGNEDGMSPTLQAERIGVLTAVLVAAKQARDAGVHLDIGCVLGDFGGAQGQRSAPPPAAAGDYSFGMSKGPPPQQQQQQPQYHSPLPHQHQHQQYHPQHPQQTRQQQSYDLASPLPLFSQGMLPSPVTPPQLRHPTLIQVPQQRPTPFPFATPSSASTSIKTNVGNLGSINTPTHHAHPQPQQQQQPIHTPSRTALSLRTSTNSLRTNTNTNTTTSPIRATRTSTPTRTTASPTRTSPTSAQPLPAPTARNIWRVAADEAPRTTSTWPDFTRAVGGPVGGGGMGGVGGHARLAGLQRA